MNPYEAPQAGDERIPEHRQQKLIVAVAMAMAVGAGMIIGGVSLFYQMRVERARAIGAAVIRAEQTAEADGRGRRPRQTAEADGRGRRPRQKLCEPERRH